MANYCWQELEGKRVAQTMTFETGTDAEKHTEMKENMVNGMGGISFVVHSVMKNTP